MNIFNKEGRFMKKLVFAVVMSSMPVCFAEEAKPYMVITSEDAPHVEQTTSQGSNAYLQEQVPVYYLPKGEMLSHALRKYVKAQGWNDLIWDLDYDYKIEAPISMSGDIVQAITDLIKTYQSYGGLMGVEPIFAKGNYIVAIRQLGKY